MSPLRNQGQSKWFKGVSAAFSTFGQPKNTVPRVSNMVLTKRGGWLTCDGTQLISQLDNAMHPLADNIGPIMELFLYEPIGLPNAYYLLRKDYNTHLGVPTGFVAVDGGAGGLLSAGSYLWVVTALDGAGGETTQSAGSSTALAANHKESLTWTAVTNAIGYNVYRTTANGSLVHLVNPTPILTNSYIDNVPDANLGAAVPPGINSTQVSLFQQMPPGTYGAANIVFTFPADWLPPKDNTPGGYGGGGGGAHPPTSGNQPPTPAGGITGNISPIPQIIQFANLMFLALGNGLSPFTSDGTNANTIQIVNTFTATYPAWAINLAFNQGDSIQATVGGTAYVFTAVQGGLTNPTAAPTWPATLNKTVGDGAGSTIIWKNAGQVSTSPPPRGAAHVEVYAGSIWVANTAPQISADQLDGPSAIRMSDANNPNSWNPLNAAQVARDDGQQISGIKSFAVAAAGIPTTNQLAVFKDFSTYVTNGVFGAADFSIQQAQTDMGCSAGRSIQYLPGFGLIRLTHLGFAIFDGLYDKVVSEEVRPYIFGGEPDIVPVDWNFAWFSKGAQVANPPMYVCACPIQGTNASSTNYPFTAQGVRTSGPVFTNGIYYIKVQGMNSDGSATITAEQKVLIGAFLNQSQYLLVTFPNAGAFVTWRVYIGSSPGGESYYVSVLGSVTQVSITNATPTTAGAPASAGGALSRVFCYDLVLKAWAIVDLPFLISTMKQIRAVGTIPITVMAGYSDGATRRWQAGDQDWDSGAVNAGAVDGKVRGGFRTAEVYAEGGSQRTFFRRLVIRGVSSNPFVSVIPTYNGSDDLTITAGIRPLGANQFEARVDLMRTIENFHATLSIVGPTEISSVDHEVVEKPVGAALVIS
jgi:hypothetical protein